MSSYTFPGYDGWKLAESDDQAPRVYGESEWVEADAPAVPTTYEALMRDLFGPKWAGWTA